MRRQLTRAVYEEDGQALVELAFALPILLVVLLVIFDFGRAINYWNSENSLANVAARYAAVGTLPSTSSDPCNGSTSSLAVYIQCEAGQYGLRDATSGKPGLQPPSSGSTVGVCVSVPTNSAGQQVTVKVYGTYNWLPLPKMFGINPTFSNVQLVGSATMRIENTVPSGWITDTTGTCPLT
jgi:Flp pilus assembly protein TadG